MEPTNVASPLATADLFGLFIEHGEAFKSMVGLVSLCCVRAYAAKLVLPTTSDQAIHGVIRNALVLIIGLFIAWGQNANLLNGVSTGAMAMLALKEALLGVALGFAAGTVFWVAEGVGSMIDNQAGYNNVQQTNPQSSSQSTPVGNLMLQLAIAAFYMLGGMMVWVGLLFESFQWWPLDVLKPSSSDLIKTFVQTQLMSCMSAIARLAAPALLLLLLVDLGIGLLSKTADKLEANNLAQPLKGALTMLILALLLSTFVQQLRPQLALKSIAEDMRKWRSDDNSSAPPGSTRTSP